MIAALALLVMQPPGEVVARWLPLFLSLLISTAATLVVTALVMKWCMRGQTAQGDAP